MQYSFRFARGSSIAYGAAGRRTGTREEYHNQTSQRKRGGATCLAGNEQNLTRVELLAGRQVIDGRDFVRSLCDVGACTCSLGDETPHRVSRAYDNLVVMRRARRVN